MCPLSGGKIATITIKRIDFFILQHYCLLFTPTYCNSMHQNRTLCPSALILSLTQCVTVAFGYGSRCPRLQFRQSEPSVFQCFDGSRVRALVCSFVSSSSTSSGWYDSHQNTFTVISASFLCPSQKKRKTIHTDSYLWHARLSASSIQVQIDDLYEEYLDISITRQLHSERLINHVA